MYFVDRTAVVLKPTEAFLAWLKSVHPDMPDVNLAQLRSNCTTLLVPQFDTPEAVVSYVGEHYRRIFEAEVAAWEVPQAQWPQDMSLAAFWAWFEAEIHDMVLDMEAAELQLSSVAGAEM